MPRSDCVSSTWRCEASLPVPRKGGAFCRPTIASSGQQPGREMIDRFGGIVRRLVRGMRGVMTGDMYVSARAPCTRAASRHGAGVVRCVPAPWRSGCPPAAVGGAARSVGVLVVGSRAARRLFKPAGARGHGYGCDRPALDVGRPVHNVAPAAHFAGARRARQESARCARR